MASGFEAISEKHLALKKAKAARGELNQVAVNDSDDELLAEDASDSAAAKDASADLQGRSVNADYSACCPACGK